MLTVSNISFGASTGQKDNPIQERHRKRQEENFRRTSWEKNEGGTLNGIMMSKISEMTDDEIVQASIKNANEKALQSKAACALKKGPLTFIAATSIAYGALKNGKLSDKVAHGIGTMATGVLAAGLIDPVHNVVDKVFNGKKDLNEDKKYTPVQFVAELGALALTSTLLIKGGIKGSEKLAQKFAPTAQSVAAGVARAAKALDTSILGKKAEELSEGFQKFASNHPSISEAVKASAVFAPAAAFLAKSASLTNEIVRDRNQSVADNVGKLLLCREYAKAIEAKPLAPHEGVDLNA